MQAALKHLESLVHPLVYSKRRQWLQQCVSEGRHRVLVLDIPLLYETDAEGMVWRTSMPHCYSDAPSHLVMFVPVPSLLPCPSSTVPLTPDRVQHEDGVKPSCQPSPPTRDHTCEQVSFLCNDSFLMKSL